MARAKLMAAGPVPTEAAAMDDTQRSDVVIGSGKDLAGNPAVLATPPVITVDDPSVCSIQMTAADGTTPTTSTTSGVNFQIVSGAPGTTTVHVVAQGDPTPGVNDVAVDINVAVGAGESTGLNVVIAPPVPK